MTERPDLRSVATQCNLLAAPPLWKLVREADASHEAKAEEDVSDEAQTESITSEAEDTDLDTSFQVIQEDPTTE